MKNNLKISIIAALTALYAFSGCNTPNRALNHLRKAEKLVPGILTHNGEPSTASDTVVTIDSVYFWKDSIMLIKETVIITDSIRVPCPNIDWSRITTKAELKNQRKMYQDSLNNAVKMYKLETKRLSDSLDYYKRIHISDNRTKSRIEGVTWFEMATGRYWWLLVALSFLAGYLLRSKLSSLIKLKSKKNQIRELIFGANLHLSFKM